jgi:hypothetical protein
VLALFGLALLGSALSRMDGRAIRSLVNHPALDYDELRFDYGDVVLAAIGWSEWQSLERSLTEGLACVSEADQRGEHVEPAVLHAATVAFRRARGLIAGDDYLRWLADRSLSTADLSAHIVRSVLRQAAEGRLDDVLGAHPPGSEALVNAIRAEAILGGRLRSWSERLARCAAAAHGLAAEGEEPAASEDATTALVEAAARCQAGGLSEAQARERAPRVAALMAAERRFCDRIVTPERIARCLAEHRLDWQRFVWQEVAFESEGAAREAALWVREEGLTLAEVAGMAHAQSSVREAYCSETAELSGLLMAAAPGDLLGPLAGDGSWRLACLHERASPAVEDPVLRARAAGELVESAIERHLAGRVSWHGER